MIIWRYDVVHSESRELFCGPTIDPMMEKRAGDKDKSKTEVVKEIRKFLTIYYEIRVREGGIQRWVIHA
jgi:hypothetical protein